MTSKSTDYGLVRKKVTYLKEMCSESPVLKLTIGVLLRLPSIPSHSGRYSPEIMSILKWISKHDLTASISWKTVSCIEAQYDSWSPFVSRLVMDCGDLHGTDALKNQYMS